MELNFGRRFEGKWHSWPFPFKCEEERGHEFGSRLWYRVWYRIITTRPTNGGGNGFTPLPTMAYLNREGALGGLKCPKQLLSSLQLI